MNFGKWALEDDMIQWIEVYEVGNAGCNTLIEKYINKGLKSCTWFLVWVHRLIFRIISTRYDISDSPPDPIDMIPFQKLS